MVSAKNSPTLTDLRNHLRRGRWFADPGGGTPGYPHERHYVDEKEIFVSAIRILWLSCVNARKINLPSLSRHTTAKTSHTDETEIISAKEVVLSSCARLVS